MEQITSRSSCSGVYSSKNSPNSKDLASSFNKKLDKIIFQKNMTSLEQLRIVRDRNSPYARRLEFSPTNNSDMARTGRRNTIDSEIDDNGRGGSIDRVDNNIHMSNPTSMRSRETSQSRGDYTYGNIDTNSANSSKDSLNESTTNGNVNDHRAYKVYKEAGNYWEKYPKTDYTYLKFSSHRQEIAPGVIPMPNMSRRSLESTRTMREERSPEYRRSIDSVDSVYSTCTDKSEPSSPRTKGIFSSSTSVITSTISNLFHIICRIFSFLLFGDIFNRQYRSKKSFLIWLFVFLPALLTGVHFYLNPEKFPPSNIFDISEINNIKIPKFSELKIPEFPKLKIPEFPKLKIPEIKIPKLSNIQIPEFLKIEIPSINSSNYINYEQLDNFKMIIIDHFENIKIWSADYFTYLKTVTKNILYEVQRIWLENFH